MSICPPENVSDEFVSEAPSSKRGRGRPRLGEEREIDPPASTTSARQLRRRDTSEQIIYDEHHHSLALEANIAASMEHQQEAPEPGDSRAENTTQVATVPMKRPRGRPPKNPGEPKKTKTSTGRPRGRPRKIQGESAAQEATPAQVGQPAQDESEKHPSTPSAPVAKLLWTLVDEHLLQQSWTATDQACLDQHCITHPAEISLWELISNVFEKHLPDLFTYGLKLDDSKLPAVTIEGQTLLNPGYISAAVSENLQVLLCHPIWEGNLSLVCYALQIAVMHRVPGHIFPIAPLPSSASWANMTKSPMLLHHTSLAQEFNFSLYEAGHPCSRRMIQQLCDMLAETVEKEATEDPRLSAKILFLLQDTDIQAVISAVDRLTDNGMKPARTCKDYLLHYNSTAEHRRSSSTARCDLEILKRNNKAWMLATRRNWIMAVRHWKRNAEAAEDETRAYDIPEGDAYPAHVYCEQLGRSEAHLALLRGTIWPLSKTAAPELGL